MNILQKIYNGSKIGKLITMGLLILIVSISYVIEITFWAISRPFVFMAHLFLFHPHTDMEELTFKISHSLKDPHI